MRIYYLDTSIWIDYYEKRGINGEHAFRLIQKIIEDESVIVCSDLHVKELKGLGYSMDEINSVFRIARPNKVRRVHVSREQIKQALQLAARRSVPKRDALHAILARDSEAVLIATDKHFDRLLDFVTVHKPEELY